jgi:nitrite reductase/ring-hydroxylating ferredoxin subunit
MNLSQLVANLDLDIQPQASWAILGPEADAFRAKLPAARLLADFEPDLDGLLLVGALSARSEAQPWLDRMSAALEPGATLIVIDWQWDGPLDTGPDLERRFKRGRLCRLLRASGFGLVETLESQARHYIIRAVKGSARPEPHAGTFVAVASVAELPKNAMKVVNVFGHAIIVANTGREIIAIARACPHENSPLDQGLLRGRNIVCPLHAYIWNVYTGEPVEPADEDTLRRYPVKVDQAEGQIFVAVAAPESA